MDADKDIDADQILIDAARRLFEPRDGTGVHTVWKSWIDTLDNRENRPMPIMLQRVRLSIRRAFAITAEGRSPKDAILQAMYEQRRSG